MKRRILFIGAVLMAATLLLSGCGDKPGEKAAEKSEEVAKAEKPSPPVLGPHGANDVKKWIKDAEDKADKEMLEKLKGNTAKFSAGELLLGIAVRPKPDFWGNVTEKEKLKTIAIMNTNFSKARIDAGMEEGSGVLNSTMYIEDDKGNIIAVSDKEKGEHLLETPGMG